MELFTLILLVIGVACVFGYMLVLLDVAQKRNADPSHAWMIGLVGALCALGAPLPIYLSDFSLPGGAVAALWLLSFLGLVFPLILVWFLPGQDPVHLSTAHKLKKGIAPVLVFFGALLGYSILWPFQVVLDKGRTRKYGWTLQGWWTEEMAAGAYPVGWFELEHEEAKKSSIRCGRCGSANYNRLSHCVNCGEPLPQLEASA